jgi:hypothetical protein
LGLPSPEQRVKEPLRGHFPNFQYENYNTSVAITFGARLRTHS